MANNILEQLEELYSRWSMAEKVGKEMQLENMWQQLSGSYNYLFQIYNQRGYLTPEEARYANQLSQMLAGLQAQKIRVDQELSEEMMKHLAKMIVKRFN
jgi:methylphosphotriester-DNA--protein-cysteine methyltransferase